MCKVARNTVIELLLEVVDDTFKSLNFVQIPKAVVETEEAAAVVFVILEGTVVLLCWLMVVLTRSPLPGPRPAVDEEVNSFICLMEECLLLEAPVCWLLVIGCVLVVLRIDHSFCFNKNCLTLYSIWAISTLCVVVCSSALMARVLSLSLG
ncbi:hypothetical protein FF38_00933 [Lucilia cuprina]|uniref:Uncharacterized protein n=1 Tax=Lucilia cuprina TaxID=7375 RepID=A0A0L0BM51_LUCCU|nr:hypothetical protein FF38_00933 [Lucilia cuprina]